MLDDCRRLVSHQYTFFNINVGRRVKHEELLSAYNMRVAAILLVFDVLFNYASVECWGLAFVVAFLLLL